MSAPRAQSPTSLLLDALTGRRHPGGCPDCGAYHTMHRDEDGVYHLTVHHDDGCPERRRLMKGRRR